MFRSALPEAYQTQLRAHYHDAISDQVVIEPQRAELPEQPGETIPYLRINKGASKPLFYIPGLGESIINKVSFAAELATQGYDVVLPGQNRKSRLKGAARGPRAAAAQARNYDAVLVAENLETAPDFLAHSYGSVILEAMVQRIDDRQPGYTSDSTALLLAPACLVPETSLLDMARRWARMLKSEMNHDTQDFPDTDGVTGVASAKTLLANLLRTTGELGDLRRHVVNMPYLLSQVSRLAVVSYAEDVMFPERHIAPGAIAAVEAGASWLTPYSLQVMPDGKLRGGRGAVHDDEQLNPSRVAGAIGQFLWQT